MAEKSQRRTSLAVLAAVLVVGVGVGVGATRLLGGERAEPAAAPPVPTTTGDPDALAELPALGAPIPPDQATSPEQAVAGFLTAEASGDFTASYAFLAASDHETFPTPALWTQSHGNYPVVTGYRIESSAPAERGVRVTTLTGYQPDLDEILGLTTARARSTWSTVEEGEVWRVQFALSSDQRLYPDDDPAAEVARAWAQRRLACEPTDQLEDGLKGIPALGSALCGAEGELRLGPLAVLDQLDDVTPLVSAYGPDVLLWARAVPVEAPEPMQIVLAPLGADWKVMGVIRGPIGRG